MRLLGTSVLLFALWLAMSGLREPLIIGFGAASAIAMMFVTRRMDAVDGDKTELAFKPLQFLKYTAWLPAGIAKANRVMTRAGNTVQ